MFQDWDYTQLRNLCAEAKDRILQEGECLFRDGTQANYVYMLLEGKLRVEKEVLVSAINYWPLDRANWCERTIKNKVLFKIRDIEPMTFLGEQETVNNNTFWPV